MPGGLIEQDLNLIRKIVWSYVAAHPGLEFEDAFSEACVAYLEALPSYKAELGKRSTYMYHVIRNRMRTLVHNEMTRQCRECAVGTIPATEDIDPEEALIAKERWREMLSSLSPEAITIHQLLVESRRYNLETSKPRKCRGQIIQILRDMGWSWKRVWSGMHELKEAVVQAL